MQLHRPAERACMCVYLVIVQVRREFRHFTKGPSVLGDIAEG